MSRKVLVTLAVLTLLVALLVPVFTPVAPAKAAAGERFIKVYLRLVYKNETDPTRPVIGWLKNEKVIVAVYNITTPGEAEGEFPLVVKEVTTNETGWICITLWEPRPTVTYPYPYHLPGRYNITIIWPRTYGELTLYHLIYSAEWIWNDFYTMNGSEIEIEVGAVKFMALTEEAEPLFAREKAGVVHVEAKIWHDRFIDFWSSPVRKEDGVTKYWFNFTKYIVNVTFVPGEKLHVDAQRELEYRVYGTWSDLKVTNVTYRPYSWFKTRSGRTDIWLEAKVVKVTGILLYGFDGTKGYLLVAKPGISLEVRIYLLDEEGNIIDSVTPEPDGTFEFLAPNATLTMVVKYLGTEVNVTSKPFYDLKKANELYDKGPEGEDTVTMDGVTIGTAKYWEFTTPGTDYFPVNCTVIRTAIRLYDMTPGRSYLSLPTKTIMTLPNGMTVVVRGGPSGWLPLPPYWTLVEGTVSEYTWIEGAPYYGLIPVSYATMVGTVKLEVYYRELLINKTTLDLEFDKLLKVFCTVYEAQFKLLSLAERELTSVEYKDAAYQMITEDGIIVAGGIPDDKGTIRYYGPAGTFKLKLYWKGYWLDALNVTVTVADNIETPAKVVFPVKDVFIRVRHWTKELYLEGFNVTLTYPDGFMEPWNWSREDGYVEFVNVPCEKTDIIISVYTNATTDTQYITPFTRPEDAGVLVYNGTLPVVPLEPTAKGAHTIVQPIWVLDLKLIPMTIDFTRKLTTMKVLYGTTEIEYPTAVVINGTAALAKVVPYIEATEVPPGYRYLYRRIIYNFSILVTTKTGEAVIESKIEEVPVEDGKNVTGCLFLANQTYPIIIVYGGVVVYNGTARLPIPTAPGFMPEFKLNCTVMPFRLYGFLDEDVRYVMPGLKYYLYIEPALNVTAIDKFDIVSHISRYEANKTYYDGDYRPYYLNVTADNYMEILVPFWTNTTGVRHWMIRSLTTGELVKYGMIVRLEDVYATTAAPGVAEESMGAFTTPSTSGLPARAWNVTLLKPAVVAGVKTLWNWTFVLTLDGGELVTLVSLEVLTPEGKPAVGYPARLFCKETKIAETVTDAEGIATFTLLEPKTTITLPNGTTKYVPKVTVWENKEWYVFEVGLPDEMHKEYVRYRDLVKAKLNLDLLEPVLRLPIEGYKTLVDGGSYSTRWMAIHVTVVDANGKPVKTPLIVLVMPLEATKTGGAYIAFGKTDTFGTGIVYVGGVYVGETYVTIYANETLRVDVFWSVDAFEKAEGKPIAVGYGIGTVAGWTVPVESRIFTCILKFITDTGAPAAGLDVTVAWPDGIIAVSGKTDENGLFKVGTQVPVGDYEVTAKYKGISVYKGVITVDANVDEKAWAAGKGLLRTSIYDIRFKIYLVTGEPLKGGIVKITLPTGEEVTFTTNEAGETPVIAFVPVGRATVVVDTWKNVKIGKTVATVDITASKTYEVEFKDVGVLKVAVLGERGQGLAPASVEIYLDTTLVEKGTTDEAGVYVTVLPADKTYRIKVSYKGLEKEETATVAAGVTPTEVRVSLPVYYVFFGRPLTATEFWGMIAAIIIIVILIVIGLHEYSLWRKRRLVRPAPAAPGSSL
ncbi:MAG: hypothetical protein DRM97_05745, partial [Thermoprotei archaeon]